MAYTPVQDTFRVVSIVHASTLPDPIGGSFDEQIGWTESRPGTRLSPATCIDSYGLEAEGRTSLRFTPIVRNTSNTLTFTLLEYDNATTGTVVITGMLAGEAKGDFNSKPHTFSQKFRYNAGNVENISPVSQT